MSKILQLLQRSCFTRLSFELRVTHVRHINKTKFHSCMLPKDLALKGSIAVATCTSRCQSTRQSATVDHENVSTLRRIKRRIFDAFSDQSKINMSACLVYEKCADGIDWNQFLKYFDLPDTFQSWFLAIQLHVWMCILVSIPEKSGRLFRNSLVDVMWSDVEIRLSHLAEMKSSRRKEYLTEMVDQFQAALISYDEGILGDDTVLAAAAWRTFFSFRYVDPRLLENMVFYIRNQISHLDSLSSENLMLRGSISFLPLCSILNIEEKV